MNKRKFNTNKGITLSTLIIIVAVLAIIASVTIGTVKENKIIGHSQTAVKEFSELQFREQLEVIFLSYVTANQRGLSINNKKITNKILNIFDYPNIDTETGLLDEELGTTDFYTMTAEEGHVNVKNNSTSETILDVTYDKENNPKFTIMYKDLVYEYDNYKLAKVDYYVNGNPDEWTWTELEDGTIKITAYNGNGELDSQNPGVYNLTVPNRINGMNVSQIAATGFENINGTLTISSLGLTVTSINCSNAKKIILKDDIIVNCTLGGSNTTDFIVGSRCTIKKGNVNWVNVEVGEDVTFAKPAAQRCFNGGTIKLSKQSISNILGTTLITEVWYPIFWQCDFTNSPDIVIPENSNINGIPFRGCTNIKTITIKKGSTVNTSISGGVFYLANSQLDKVEVEDNCTIGNLMYVGNYGNTATISIDKLKIGNNVNIKGYCFVGISIREIEIGKDYKIGANNAFHSLTGVEKITLHLTDEQVSDNTTIPEVYSNVMNASTGATVSDTVIDNENKTCTWYITYPESET